jgi:Leucine rich repeat variant
VSELWRRRLADRPEAHSRADERDQVLTELAGRMGMAQIEAPLAWLTQAASRVAGADGQSLVASLQHAGLVRLRPWEKVDFMHLTVQEFYLAQALSEQKLTQVLQEHWDDARYEEPLGLLITMLYQAQQFEDIEQGLRWLVDWGEGIHRRTPAMLWHRRRSPLRVALHLLHRAGVPVEHLPHMADFLWEQLSRAPRRWFFWELLRRSALLDEIKDLGWWLVEWGEATHPLGPGIDVGGNVLDEWEISPRAMQAGADEAHGRLPRWHHVLLHAPRRWLWELLRRSALRSGMFCQSAYERGMLRRPAPRKGAAASDPETPPYILQKLAQDADVQMRRAECVDRSIDTRDYLALRWVLECVIENPRTPPEVLARLAQGADEWVRRAVAENPRTPPELRARLAQDASKWVRQTVAENLRRPPELRARLAQDADIAVRRAGAE